MRGRWREWGGQAGGGERVRGALSLLAEFTMQWVTPSLASCNLLIAGGWCREVMHQS